MTDNVVNFTGVTSLDIDPTRVLKTASDQEFDSIIIVGYTKDGEEYFASSIFKHQWLTKLFIFCKTLTFG